eukprot:1159576-Pelagomonas_calceolata.AAC.5
MHCCAEMITPSHLVTEKLQPLREHTDAVLSTEHGGHQGWVAADAVQHVEHAHQQIQMRPVLFTSISVSISKCGLSCS